MAPVPIRHSSHKIATQSSLHGNIPCTTRFTTLFDYNTLASSPKFDFPQIFRKSNTAWQQSKQIILRHFQHTRLPLPEDLLDTYHWWHHNALCALYITMLCAPCHKLWVYLLKCQCLVSVGVKKKKKKKEHHFKLKVFAGHFLLEGAWMLCSAHIEWCWDIPAWPGASLMEPQVTDIKMKRPWCSIERHVTSSKTPNSTTYGTCTVEF